MKRTNEFWFVFASLCFGGILCRVTSTLKNPPKTLAQQTIELTCPAGQSTLSPLVSRNPGTGGLRQYGCIDLNGNLFLQPRRIGTSGTPVTISNFSLSAGWGTTASISDVSRTDQAFQVSVNATGTGQAPSPNIILTFIDGTFTSVNPIYVCGHADINTPIVPWVTSSSSTTQLNVLFNGTPTASSNYIANCVTVSR